MASGATDAANHVYREEITNALREVGVQCGDTVMFHSSLSSLGWVVGGADTVIDGFLDAVGPEGTVAVPTLCRMPDGERHLTFDRWNIETSVSCVGRITEVLRHRPDAIRSDHGTHSVSAIGPRARELTANHGTAGLRLGPWDPRAFAWESPWQKFYDWNVAYCFLGVNFLYNTMVHFVESRLVERALARAAPERREQLAAQIEDWQKPGVWPSIGRKPREAIEQFLYEKGLLRYGTIGAATIRCTRARVMVDNWLALAEADPPRWCSESFVEWLRQIDT
ncbi:MAG: AAC(3) family N-acetyltransferase [Chloroflexota bacterium]|nr:AAC(3) family N-acetyltransferase [Chloroflexota bacterium]MDE2839750.1 AAC(3) family N-acetyltransferase [Chloroflexota bacterium]MDE2929577.1 AAC(3) family N-acetyltransferase [Chloroflexota bacterium]